ncbi:MAG: hypothetical protein D6717_04150 [Gammaproteobacteria bacterium]|nr:MAG: hypothetical protein D6717_04150 [Gammaproteobacteria bacterium]
MLTVHGNAWDHSHAFDDIGQCRQLRDVWERMRKESRELRRVWKANDMRALHDRPPKNSFRHFRCVRPIPKRLKNTLALLQSHGLLSGLRYPAPDQVCYEQHGQDIIKLIAGGWLERWLGAVLADAGIAWRGARVSAKVLEKGGGSQEFDFLGAHRNHLVYWSCKTDAKLTNDKLFEVDALRDGIAGSDFHIAGLLHAAPVMPTMRAKARRMNLHMVCALEDDAAAQVIRISGG